MHRNIKRFILLMTMCRRSLNPIATNIKRSLLLLCLSDDKS
ncbi:hypothetical protein [Nostoc sp. LEGE 12447]|nr:hypothetical protein [Nostoc sp. LEGE 12447]